MNKILSTIWLLGSITSWDVAQDKWAVAESEILRLPPAVFTQLPSPIIRYLQTERCTVPQTYLSSVPHNVTRGEFGMQGRSDWVVLCSRRGKSSIFIFWDSSLRRVSRIANVPDQNYLQTIDGGGKIAFSRFIEAVGKDHINNKYNRFGGTKPPAIFHQGISDAFAEKASVIRYFYRGKWLELTGAD